MSGSDNLPPKALQYLEEKNIAGLMENIMHELMITLPEKPVDFLIDFLKYRSVPKVIISGPPAAGKRTVCEKLKESFGFVYISTGDLLRAEVKKGSKIGVEADALMQKGELVPDAHMVQLVVDRLAEQDVKENGWCLDGFPRTKGQALAMQSMGVIPHKFVLLNCPDEVVIERIEGRRTDPETGKVYHLTFNPPPEDEEVQARLEQRTDDTREAILSQLSDYHRNMKEISSAYERVTIQVDGQQSIDTVAEELHTALKELLPHE